MSLPSLHIVACPYPAKGHFRPSIAFITNVVEKHANVIVTLLAFRTFVPFSEEEINRAGIPAEAAKRIRVIGLSEAVPEIGLAAMKTFMTELFQLAPVAYGMLANGAPVTCTSTGTVFNYAGIPPPRLVLNDWMTPYCGQAFKAITPSVKVLIFWISTVGYFIRTTGPKELGGFGSWQEETKVEAEKEDAKGKSLSEVGLLVENNYMSRGAQSPNPEGIQWYDYEMYPQELPRDPAMVPLMWDSLSQIYTFADGIAFSTIEAFEPKSVAAVRKFVIEDLSKKVFFTGPLPSARLLSSPGVRSADKPTQEKYVKLFEFLDAQQPRTVWLISFGTIFFPFQRPHHLVILINTLIKTRTPFILSQAGLASAYAPLSPETKDAVEKSGLGVILDSVPQQEVLQHPSLGAFVTHGGVNSTFESIVLGVVPVFWPFVADQPFHAAYLSQIRDAGFELIQIRTGIAAKNPLQGSSYLGTDEAIGIEIESVISDLKGDVGAQKRKNLKVMRDELEAAFSSGKIQEAAEAIVTFAQE